MMAKKRETTKSVEDVLLKLEVMSLPNVVGFNALDYSQEDRFRIACARMENEGLDTREACKGVMSRTGFNDLLRMAKNEIDEEEIDYDELLEEYEECEGSNAWILNHYARARKGLIEFWEEEARKVVYNSGGDASHIEMKKDANGKMVYFIKANNEFVQRSKLKFDFIMWKLAHLAPKKYGKQAIAGKISKGEDDESGALSFVIDLSGE